jgi:CRP/FNR family cyclic AMP-dependent transcriptional regulator
VASDPLQKFARAFQPGAVIFREGEPGGEMYVIQKGKVRVAKDYAGKPHVISVLQKGDFFGEMSIVSRAPRSATVSAVDDVEVLAFDLDGLHKMIARNPRIGISIIERLCRRLQAANLKVQYLVQRDLEGLIALHLHHLFQELPGGATNLPLTTTLDNASLAFELPTVEIREAVDRLAAAGVVAVEGDWLAVRDAGRLATMAESAARGPAGTPSPPSRGG